MDDNDEDYKPALHPLLCVYRPLLHYKFNLKRRRMAHILSKRHEIIFFFYSIPCCSIRGPVVVKFHKNNVTDTRSSLE